MFSENILNFYNSYSATFIDRSTSFQLGTFFDEINTTNKAMTPTTTSTGYQEARTVIIQLSQMKR